MFKHLAIGIIGVGLFASVANADIKHPFDTETSAPTTWESLFETVFTKWGQDLTPGMGTFSRGWRLGYLEKCSMKGMIRRSSECSMKVGNESTYLEKTECSTDSKGNTDCTKKIINPWFFSSGPENFRTLDAIVGAYYIIEYAQSTANLPVASGRDTDYEFVRILRPTLKPVTCQRTNPLKGNFSNGNRTGRLVKLSVKGVVNKSFEATIQVGKTGSEFAYMSITDASPEFVYCAFTALFSGKMVTVNYAQDLLYNPTRRDTPYEIVSITAPGGSNSVQSLD